MVKRILLLLLLSAFAVSAQAQWLQTAGPANGSASTIASDGANTLAVIGNDLYRLDGGSWKLLRKDWDFNLVGASGLILALKSEAALLTFDGGQRWEPITLPTNLIFSDGQSIYALGEGDSLFQSTNASNWSFKGRLPQSSLIPTVHNGKFYTYSMWDALRLSIDQGVTWSLVTTDLPFSTPMQIKSSGEAMYVIDYSGEVFESRDDGKTWDDISGNLKDKQLTNLASHSDVVIVSDWANTWKRAGNNWEITNIGKIHTSITTPLGEYVATASGVYNLTAGQITSTTLGTVSSNVTKLGSVGTTLFAYAESGLYRTRDRGITWEHVSPEITVDLATVDNTLLQLGAGVRRSSDEGTTWESLDEVLEEHIVWPTNLVARGNDVYLTSGHVFGGEHGSGAGWTTGGVYVSRDKGTTWQDISGNLPHNGVTHVPVFSIAITDDALLIHTAEGLYYSSRTGINWRRSPAPDAKAWVMAMTNGTEFYLSLDQQWFKSSDGSHWTPLSQTNTPFGEFEYVQTSQAVGGKLHITTIESVRQQDSTWKQFTRNYRLDGGDNWVDITASLPANTSTNVLHEMDGYVYAGTTTSGVWKMPLSSASVRRGTPKELRAVRYVLPGVVEVAVSSDFRVFDVLGNDVTNSVVSTRSLESIQLDVSRLMSGSYTLVAQDHRYKFIK